MLTTYLIEHRWIPPVLLAGLVLLGPPVGAWLSSRPALARGAAAISLVPVAVLVLAPTSTRGTGRCEVAWTVPTFARVELAANVVLLVGPVLLAAVALGRVLPALGAGVALPVAIETVQLVVPSLGRACSTADWLSNSLGAALGAVLGALALGLARHRTSRRVPLAGVSPR
ncbi:VanZ family protein [Nocardioides litoris]|uniref:VanZ family protein n=1 Tax=Nocardioides litoris TaxID=1926648 RepID=UPI001476C63D|nr:VanZ family protein [Nocardioides litoris]